MIFSDLRLDNSGETNNIHKILTIICEGRSCIEPPVDTRVNILLRVSHKELIIKTDSITIAVIRVCDQALSLSLAQAFNVS